MRRLKPALIALLVLLPLTSTALPRFSIRTGVKCQSCHINPTGKGMRTYFGRSYGFDDLSMPTWKESSTIDDFSVELTPNISVGADIRTMFLFERRRNTSSFLQMQGDIYLDLQINRSVRVFYDRGLYSGFELFAIAKVLPANGYVKIGKFMPAYGTRVDDHNAFIRGGPYGGGPFIAQFTSLASAGYVTGLRFGERSEDTGVELGIAPGPVTIQAAVLNGLPGGSLSGVSGTKFKTISVRGDAMVKLTGVNIMGGGSYYRLPSAVSTETFYGVFGALSLKETYTLNSEFDRVSVQTGGKSLDGFIFWNELNVLVSEGIDIKVGYEFYDPDENVKNGSFTRILFGAEIFVLPGVELRPLYRLNREEPREFSNDEIQVLLHFFF